LYNDYNYLNNMKPLQMSINNSLGGTIGSGGPAGGFTTTSNLGGGGGMLS